MTESAAQKFRDELLRENRREIVEDAAALARECITQSLRDHAAAAREIEHECRGWLGVPVENQWFSMAHMVRCFGVSPAVIRTIA